MSEFVDREIQCKDCPNKFVFSAGEQEFFAQKQLQDPVRCKPCRAAKRAQKEAGGGNNGSYNGNGGYNAGSGNGRPVVTEVSNRRGGGGGRDRGGRRRHDDNSYE